MKQKTWICRLGGTFLALIVATVIAGCADTVTGPSQPGLDQYDGEQDNVERWD